MLGAMTDLSTGIPLVDALIALLSAYGYPVTFFGTVLENVFIIGSPTPGDVIVLAAGFVSTAGALNPLVVWLLAFLGTVTGSNVSYLIGRKGGRPMLLQYGDRFLGHGRLEYAEDFFLRHGNKTILFARFVAGVKNVAPTMAGACRMPLAIFELYTVLGAAGYAALMVTLGYFFGDNFALLLEWVKRAGYVGLAVVAIVLVVAYLSRRSYLKRKIVEAEADLAARGEGPAGEDAE